MAAKHQKKNKPAKKAKVIGVAPGMLASGVSINGLDRSAATRVIEEVPKLDVPKIPIHGPGDVTVVPQVTTSEMTPTPASVSTTLLCWPSGTQLGRSPPAIMPFLLSVI